MSTPSDNAKKTGVNRRQVLRSATALAAAAALPVLRPRSARAEGPNTNGGKAYLFPADFKALDRDPLLSAAEIFDYAPKTMDALIALYCDAAAEEYPPGRHVETADIKGDRL